MSENRNIDIRDIILQVELKNDRTNWVKHHKPNLGPYSNTNIEHCVDCGKAASEWLEFNERCVPAPK